ncbi:MAG TPA: hypothetical protein VGI03_09225 [Verrucomicrobiae bacterium]|jgi:hypothetical protein
MKPSMQDTVSLQTAFVIMQRYLDWYYKHTSKDVEVGSLLGDVQMLQDGGTGDPAALGDWLTIAEAVIDGRQGPLFIQLTPKPRP